jgi:uncharacterized protein YdbL (DUF1318 family)
MRTFLTSLVLLTTFTCMNLVASPLDDAREAGQIIETPDGYVKAAAGVPAAGVPADITALVADINKRRQEAYAKIAKKNGLPAKQVGEESYKKRTAN